MSCLLCTPEPCIVVHSRHNCATLSLWITTTISRKNYILINRLNPQLGQGKGSYFFFPPFNPNLAMQLEEKRDNQTLENFYCHMRTLNPEAKIGPALGE